MLTALHRLCFVASCVVTSAILAGAPAPAPRLTVTLDEPLGVYVPGQAPTAHITGQGIDASAKTVAVRIVDFTQQPIWRNSAQVKLLPEGRITSVLALPASEKQGYFELQCLLLDANGVTLAKGTKPFVIMPEPPSIARTEANAFGAMVFPHIHYPFEDRERDARFMQRLGMKYVRTARLNWINAQAGPDAPFVWTHIDREVDLYQKFGLRIIATTGWPTPRWASSARDFETTEDKGYFMASPEGVTHSRRFYRELATRHKGRIAVYEIGNEVDAYFWLGSLEHYRNHDTAGVMRDYFEYFKTLATEIHAADPGALVGPTTTSATEGSSYQPWLTTQLKLGMGEIMSAYITHYNADMNYTNAKLKEYGAVKPVFFSEIGGFSRVAAGADAFSSEMKRMIRTDYHEMVTQLQHPNTRGMCKLILREQPTYGGEGVIWAGLLTNDFNPRPNFAAYGTLVRHLAGAKFIAPLNITRAASEGWAQGFSFERDGRQVNVLFLTATTPATVTLNTADESLTAVDVMGNSTVLRAENGTVRVDMNPVLPLIVLGTATGAPGAAEIPQDILVKETVLTLTNPDFEAPPSTDGTPPGWRMITDEKTGLAKATDGTFIVKTDAAIKHGGKQALTMEASVRTKWYGASGQVPMDQVPRPTASEYLVFKVSCFAKGEKLDGKGLGYTLSFRRASGERIYFNGSTFFGFGGTYDWKELSGQNKVRVWPAATEQITFDLLLGKSTGRVWIDDVQVTAQLWRHP
jgi:hypothetical protein